MLSRAIFGQMVNKKRRRFLFEKHDLPYGLMIRAKGVSFEAREVAIMRRNPPWNVEFCGTEEFSC
jgi:hypothetical protein